MKKTIFLLIAIASFKASAQDAKTESKFSIGFNFSPDYNFRTIKSSENGSGVDVVVESRNEREIEKFGYTTGFNLSISLSKKVAFETGIKYSNKGYQTKAIDFVFEGNPTNPLLPAKATHRYIYQYIGVPLKLNLFFGEGDLRFVSGIGITTNFLLNVQSRNNFEYSDGKKETTKSKDTDGFNKIDVSPTLSLGIDYKLTNTIHLRAEPTFRYGIIKTTSTPVTEHLWNAGVNLGVSYQL